MLSFCFLFFRSHCIRIMKHLLFWIFSCCLVLVESAATQSKDIYCYRWFSNRCSMRGRAKITPLLTPELDDNIFNIFLFLNFSHQYPLVPQDTVWKCDPAAKRCSKTLVELEKNATDCLTSLRVCHMICNDYVSLWPKPSKVTFSKKLKPIDVGTISFDSKISSKSVWCIFTIVRLVTRFIFQRVNFECCIWFQKTTE